MIDLLNHYFVPIHVRNQDFAEGGSASKVEQAKKNSIYQAALKAGLPAGTVCVYLLSPTLQPLDTAPLNQSDATNPQRLTAKLQRVIQELKVSQGELVAPPNAQAVPKAKHEGSALVHLTARYLQRSGDELVVPDMKSILGSSKAGNWGDLPSESWIELTRDECERLLPAGKVQVGTSWDFDRDVSAKLLQHFYPPTENTNVATNRIDESSLRARVVAVANGVARALLEGRLKMKHPFYHRDDNNFVTAELKGYYEFDIAARQLRSLQLVTDRAKYDNHDFGVAVKFVSQ